MKETKGLYLDGQITVIAALSLGLIFMLVAAVFQSVRLSALNVHIQQSCKLATDAVFAGYSNTILDEFDILLLKKSDMINDKVRQYIQDNMEYEKGAKLISAELNNLEMITDNAGDNIRKEIVAYMKYGAVSDIVNELIYSEEEQKKSEKIKEITDEIVSCEESIYEADAKVYETIKLIEGIETNDAGITVRGNKPVPVSDYFVKAAVNGEITMSSAAIDNKLVYNAVNHTTTLYCNIDELFENMLMDVNDLTAAGDEESDSFGELSYANTYKKSVEQFKKLINGCSQKTKEALKAIDEFEQNSSIAEETINETVCNVEESKSLIGDELGGDIISDLNEMKTGVTAKKRQMCDMDAIKEALEKKNQILDNVKTNLDKLDIDLKQKDCENIKSVIEQCKNYSAGLSNEKLKFDYSGVDFESESDGLSAIKKIYSTLTDGIVSLVLQDKPISDKKLEIKDLASSFAGDYKSDESIVEEAMDTVLFDTYILDRFKSYTDMLDGDGKYDTEKIGSDLLEYSVEYILCGENSDKKNLKETILKLSVIREGTNLAYILSDKAMRGQALTLATSLLGFTGNMGIIKAGQYFIMTVWSYAESIVDLRQLYSGYKLEPVKKKGDWNLTLDNLLKCNLDVSQKKDSKGLSYEEYVRLLLFIENKVKKNYQTLGAMELRIIGKGNTDFRMKDYIYAAYGQAVFQREGIKGYYTRELVHSYA